MKKRIMMRVVVLLIMISCVLTCFIIKTHSEELSNKRFDSRLLYWYELLIGPILCAIIGFMLSFIIKRFIVIKKSRKAYFVSVAITIVYTIVHVLLIIDFLFPTSFIYGTLGAKVAMFFLNNGRYIYIILILLCTMFWFGKDEKISEGVNELT